MAKRHRGMLQDFTTQLKTARMNYVVRSPSSLLRYAILTRFVDEMAIATLNATTIADVRAHVQAYTLVVSTTPMITSGTRRAEDISFPSESGRFEEV